MLKEPLDCQTDAVFKTCLRIPAHFFFDLVRGNGITAVMAFTVFHIGDQILADQLLPGISFRKHLLKSIQNDVDDLDILLLIMSADIVGLEQASFLLNHIDSFGMVHYIEPVAHVFSVSVYRMLLTLNRVIDDQAVLL